MDIAPGSRSSSSMSLMTGNQFLRPVTKSASNPKWTNLMTFSARHRNRTSDKSPRQHHATSEQDPAPLLARRGSALATTYEATRNKAQLDEAIDLVHRAIQATPQESLVVPSLCHNLGTMLVRRSEHTGSMTDLDESIHWSLQAVSRTSEDHPRRASRLNIVATSFGRRYERTHCQSDLENAFAYAAYAISSCRPQDTDSLVYVNNLANLYALGFKASKQMHYIDAAIDLTRQVVRMAADQPERRAKWTSNLGTMIYWRYQHTHDAEDYDRAMLYAQEAAQQSHSSLPSHSVILSNLADLLAHADGDEHGQRQSLLYYLEASGCVSATARERLRAAMKAADCFISLAHWREAADVLCKAVGLLSAMEFDSLTRSDIQYALRDFTGLGALTASAFFQMGGGIGPALIALESCRGIMADLHLRDRSREHASELLCIHQSSPCRSEPDRVKVIPQMDQASLVSECKAAASAGPIVVLMATRIRCDAILIEEHRVRLIPLTKLHVDDISSFIEALQDVGGSGRGFFAQKSHTSRRVQPLGWLWETIARPVLDALGWSSQPGTSPLPRIWWIPTGALSQLPIHAAGLHEKDNGETVIDRCMSSYSPSLRSLIRARRNMHSEYRETGNHLLVSMPSTPGLPSLPLTSKEIDEVARLASELPKSEVLTSDVAANTTGQLVILQNPTKEEVLRHAAEAHVIHFAGHGISHPRDPLRSCLALKNWQEDPLTVEDVLLLNERNRGRQKQGRRPFLAYLSACSTGQTRAHDLADESMSLNTAFQLTGFRHTVANLWEMTDELLVRAATRFYTEMRRADKVTDGTIAWCVHVTTRELRDAARQDAAGFASWPAYVHSGP